MSAAFARRLSASMIGVAALIAGCTKEHDQLPQADSAARSGPSAASASAPRWPTHFGGIGRRATRAEEQAWNIDVNASGEGLPPGSGRYAEGASLFAQKCAVCHGAHGEGLATYPKLIGRDPRAGFPFGQDFHLAKTIGNYWPYSTTLYDYIHRAMPLTAPGSLRPEETYSLVAYLLAENQIIDRATVIDARSLPRIRMPARDRFVVDDRVGGAAFR